jgi:hypothetical protein
MKMNIREILCQKRDSKVISHLQQYAPVWLGDETIFPQEESILFDVIFQHNLYGWVTRRYRYDAFNDVLYHKGQTTISEDITLEIQGKEPYIAPLVTDIPNAYGG